MGSLASARIESGELLTYSSEALSTLTMHYSIFSVSLSHFWSRWRLTVANNCLGCTKRPLNMPSAAIGDWDRLSSVESMMKPRHFVYLYCLKLSLLPYLVHIALRIHLNDRVPCLLFRPCPSFPTMHSRLWAYRHVRSSAVLSSNALCQNIWTVL